MIDFVYIFGPDVDFIDPLVPVLVKIGRCIDLKSNLSSLRRARPEYSYWFVITTPGRSGELERAIHRFFISERQRGEFFLLTHFQICFLQSLHWSDVHLQGLRHGVHGYFESQSKKGLEIYLGELWKWFDNGFESFGAKTAHRMALNWK